MTLRTKAGMWIFTICAATFFLIDTRGAYFHWKELSGVWPDHAMFHAVTGLFYTQIVCLMIIICTWIPFKRGEAWAWWSIALMSIGIHGGHVVGNALTNDGLRGQQAAQGPGVIFFAGTLTALALYIVALILTKPHVSGTE